MAKSKNPIEQTITKLEISNLSKKLKDLNISPTVDINKFAIALKKINPNILLPFEKLSLEVQESVKALKNETKRFHGAKISLEWFPYAMRWSPCGDKFGYLTSATVRQSSKLDFNVVNIGLMGQLGDLMGNSGRDNSADSNIPAGYTYFGQFVDHDITLDVSSRLDVSNDATTINNMRSPMLNLDNVYGRGPALDPYLYEFPSSGPSTAIKLKLGTNMPSSGNGGSNMQPKIDFDVPRISGTNTAVIGDPRNDENLFVSQLQVAMLKFHNAVVDFITPIAIIDPPTITDIFVESKRIVTHHYQWAVVNDYLKRICGATTVTNSLGSVTAPVGSAFSMPVEFSVAAYRFGHSLIRNNYWINFGLPNESLSDAFNFVRNPHLPVRSKWVVDFNAFFPTGIQVPVFNNARKIDSILANGLETLPGNNPPNIMAVLAIRNLRRGLAVGLPSGQETALALGITPMTTAQILSGLDTAEINLLNSNPAIFLAKTPLWYYILREAAVLGNGNTLGPLGAKIVADTFIRMLKRDKESYLNKVGGFTPFLPRDVTNDFTVTDLIKFSGVNRP